jgi:hypothetical protein
LSTGSEGKALGQSQDCSIRTFSETRLLLVTDEKAVEWSRDATFVAVVQPADLGNRDDVPNRLDRP